jgi:hypothetical protein
VPQNSQEHTGGQFGYTQGNGYTQNQSQGNQVPQNLNENAGMYQTGQVPRMSQAELAQMLQNQVPLGQMPMLERQPINAPNAQTSKNSIEEEELKLEKLKLELRQQELLLKEKELRFRSGEQENS